MTALAVTLGAVITLPLCGQESAQISRSRSGASTPGIKTLAELRTARAQQAHAPRRIIANNDGCDSLYYPRDLAVTPANFLGRRTALLRGSQVDAVAYCTISSGFGFFTHRTAVGEVLRRQGADYGIQPQLRNITGDLLAQGTDPLRLVSTFARANGMEAFWSMRMNDTHDVAHTPGKPYFLFPPLKEQHPDWLVGNPQQRSKHGRWSSVNYGRSEVRELAFRYIEEVCRGYDIDGVDLDFFRHLCFFPSTAHGGKAGDQERTEMTDLIRRVRRMTEEVGLQRGRPILVLVRVPDSTGFSRDMGLDIETWLAEGLVDLIAFTDYFRLNPWEYGVQLGHRYKVPVYPSLTDPRVVKETRFKRASVEAYRGRAAKAWAAGADGLYVFNLYDINRESPLWRELGDPAALAHTRKLYFVTDVDGNPGSWLAEGARHQTIPIIVPARPVILRRSETHATTLEFGDDVSAAARSGRETVARLHLDLPQTRSTESVVVKLNGVVLVPDAPVAGWADFRVEPSSLRRGANQIEIARADAGPDTKLQDIILSIDYRRHCPAGLIRPAPGQGSPKPTRGSPSTGGAFLFASPTRRVASRGQRRGDSPRLFRRHPETSGPNLSIIFPRFAILASAEIR